MSFADLAFERLNRTAPELAPLVVSFQDMTEDLSEESNIKLGIFTLRSGGSFFFIPVVAKGSNIYPMDSVFSNEDKKFFPLSRLGIEKVKNAVKTQVGKGVKTPLTVNRNPSLRELVEPPRTGKYTYASGRMSEVLATAPESLKKEVLEKLAQDKDLMKDLHRMGFDTKEILTSLKPLEKVALEIAPEVQVITTGTNLDDDIVQTILNQGYAIIGEHREPRVVIESDINNEGFSTLKAAQPGCAYEVVYKNGMTRLGFVPKGVAQRGTGLAPEGKSPVGLQPAASLPASTLDPIFIMENGDYAYSSEAVIVDNQRDYIEAVKNVIDSGSYTDVELVEPGTKFILVTASGCVGPLRMYNKTVTSTGTIMKVEGCHCMHVTSISVVPNMKASICIDGSDIYVSPSAKALILKNIVTDEIEKDIGKAYKRREMMTYNLIKEAHTLTHDGVEFTYDGKAITKEASLAEKLAVTEGLSKEATLNLIKRAKEDSKVVFYMSKKASNTGASPAPFPEYGQPAAEDNPDVTSSRTKKQALAITSSLKNAMNTRDKQIVEATVISQFINDPNMYETIESYLPDIKEAVDKLGRAIILFRIHSEKMSDDMQSEELSDLLTALRTTFKTLGDNSIKLENLTNNVREHG